MRSTRALSALIAGAALLTSLVAPTAAWAGDPPSVAKPAVTPPRVLSKLEAPYPEGATGEAAVVIDVMVDVAGVLKELRLVEGAPPFSTAALAAAAGFRYEPAQRDGAPIAARFRIRILFTPPAPLPPPVEAEPPPPPVTTGTTGTASATGTTGALAGKPSAPRPVEVVIKGQAAPLPAREPSQVSLDARSISRIPGAFGDAFRAIETMPGVVPFASGLPYFFVRGATPSSSGYFLDSIRLPFLFHVGAGPAVVNPAIIESVDFYPGGYPARYGQQVGGIIAAETKEPSSTPHAQGLLRLFDAGAYVEAPFLDGKASAFASGRYSYTAAALSLFAPGLRLDYWDYQLGASYEVTPRERLSVFAFGSSDHLGKVDGEQEEEIFGAQFHRVQLRLDRGRRDPDAPRARLALTLGLDRSAVEGLGDVETRTISLRSDVEVPLAAALRIRGGVELSADRFSFTRSDTPLGSGDFQQQFLDAFSSSQRGTIGTYLDAVIRPIPSIELVPGIRVDVFGEGDVVKPAVDPRASARIKLLPRLISVTTFGLAHQRPSLLLPIPGLEPKELASGLQKVVAFSQGAEFDLPQSLFARLTFYHQSYTGLNDLLATCSEAVVNCLLSDRADGRSYGLEAQISRPLAKKLGGFASYTLSRTERTVNGETFVSDLDRTHVLHLALGWEFLPGFHAGAQFTAYSGRPHSLLALDDPTKPVLIGDRNALRRGWFYRLDVRLEKEWRLGRTGFISVVLEGMNVTLSKETVDVDCRVAQAGNDVPSLRCGGQEIGPIVIPSLGVEGGI